MVDYNVTNVTEAVELASEWRAKGTHSWFRGQSKSSWSLMSSLARRGKDPEEFERAQEQIFLFLSWRKASPL